MSTHSQLSDPRAAAGDSASCRGKNGQCERPTELGDLCPACVYDEVVVDDPTICRRCFRRTHHIELVSSTNRRHAVGGDVEWRVNDDGVWVLEGELYFRTDETEREVPPPRADERPVEQTACACGDFDGAAYGGKTLSRTKALEHGERLSERLEELEIEHEPELLLDTIDDLKHEPETAGKDQPVFREAVATAIETSL